MKDYIRKELYEQLRGPLSRGPNLIQAVVGSRQVGKTTLALQLFRDWEGLKAYDTADQPNTPSEEWIRARWEDIRGEHRERRGKSLLILDEVQKIPDWSGAVKKLFDEDRRLGLDIRVVLLGSSALLMQRGLSESLAGRFEIHRHNQWSFPECQECFAINFKEYLYFGGYPGGLAIRKDESRWARYMRDSLIETVLAKDILLLSPISKPILLRQAFGLAVSSPAQIISYQKMLGTLRDAGNTTTIASYLHLLSKAFLLAPLERWSGARLRQRGSIPKILVFDNGLITSMSGLGFQETKKDAALEGRLVENAVGAKLYFMAQKQGGELFYWRDRDDEVDYVLKIGSKIKAIEVKLGVAKGQITGLMEFQKKYKKSQAIIISDAKSDYIGTQKNINLLDFFSNPSLVW